MKGETVADSMEVYGSEDLHSVLFISSFNSRMDHGPNSM